MIDRFVTTIAVAVAVAAIFFEVKGEMIGEEVVDCMKEEMIGC